MKKAFILLAIYCVLSGCTEKKTVPSVKLHNIFQSRIIQLSEMLSDIRVVRLETSEGILLPDNTIFLVSEHYIVTIDEDKILQFSGEGKFVRTLMRGGRGPDEFYRAETFTLDGDNSILYLNHRGDPQHILLIDLEDGRQIKRIPTGVDNRISQIYLYDDSTLVIVPRMNERYNFYYLSTTGEIQDGMAPPLVKGIGLETSVKKVLNHLYYMPKEFDTLYLVNETTTEPYCYFEVEDRFTVDNNEIGNFVFCPVMAPDFLIANKIHATILLNPDGETFSMNADKATLYWIDRRDFSVSEVAGLHNDFLGFEESFDPWNNFLTVQDDLGFVRYSAFGLKQLIQKTLESEEPDTETRNRLSSLNEQIDENDNPVLLIGKLKKD